MAAPDLVGPGEAIGRGSFDGFPRRSRQLVWSLLVPGALTALEYRFLVPTQASTSAGSASQTIARFCSENPLVVILALFLATSAVIQYWRRHFYGDAIRERSRPWSRARFAAVAALVIGGALFLRTFIGEVYRVTGVSMLPGIAWGDRLLVWKSAYGVKIPGLTHRIGERMPRRGDVVVFKSVDPVTKVESALVKRVIGLPGDVVAFSGHQLSVNRFALPLCDAGPYINFSNQGVARGRLIIESIDNESHLTIQTIGLKGFQSYVVRKDEVFVAGDDRVMSVDSRAMNDGQGGGIPIANILGKVNRVLVGGRIDGGLDFSRVMKSIGLGLYQPGVDLSKSREWIQDCLKESHPSTVPAKPLDL
jgi:signal peptidase I